MCCVLYFKFLTWFRLKGFFAGVSNRKFRLLKGTAPFNAFWRAFDTQGLLYLVHLLLQALEKVHETFESDMEAELARVGQLERIAQELESLNYYNSAAVNQRMQGIKDSFSNLQQLSDNRRERIQNAIAAQQKLDSMRLDYAKRAAVSGREGGEGRSERDQVGHACS